MFLTSIIGLYMPKSKKFIEPGFKCGCIKIIKDSGISDINGKKWICECDCGKIITVSASLLNQRNKRSIKSCGCKRYEKLKKGTKDISGTYLSSIQNSAKHRGIEFNVSPEYLQLLWEKQNGKCYLSGLDIKLINKRNFQGQTASLDRIDSSKGYIEGNIQWVHRDINNMKSSMSDEKFIWLCEEVFVYQKSIGYLEKI